MANKNKIECMITKPRLLHIINDAD